MSRIALLVGITLIILNCSKAPELEKRFFLENEEAIMPVLIEGNTASQTFVIMVHGGPGGSSINSYLASGFTKDLLDDFAFVYYDQRCSGTSQGKCDPHQLSIAKHVEDLQQLITLLEYHYGNDISIFLHGHSWGSSLSMAYAIAHPESKLKGAILLAGPHHFRLNNQKAKDYVMEFGQQMVDKGIKANRWQSLIDEVKDQDPHTLDGLITINEAANRTQSLLVKMDSIGGFNLDLHIRSSITGIIPGLFAKVGKEFQNELLDMDFSSQLSEIRIPIAMYAGRLDFVVPPSVISDAFQRLETPNREFHVFEKSGHSPIGSENEAYLERLAAFVARYQ